MPDNQQFIDYDTLAVDISVIKNIQRSMRKLPQHRRISILEYLLRKVRDIPVVPKQ